MKTVVRDLMTVPARRRADAGFKEMVEVMERQGISALPVADGQGHILGVVSEADLLLKEERAELQEAHLFESSSRRTARAKAEACSARQLMTSPSVTATESMPFAKRLASYMRRAFGSRSKKASSTSRARWTAGPTCRSS